MPFAFFPAVPRAAQAAADFATAEPAPPSQSPGAPPAFKPWLLLSPFLERVVQVVFPLLVLGAAGLLLSTILSTFVVGLTESGEETPFRRDSLTRVAEIHPTKASVLTR